MIMKGFPGKDEQARVVRFYKDEMSNEALGSVSCTWKEIKDHERGNFGIVARFGFLKSGASKGFEDKKEMVSLLMQEVINQLERGEVVFYWVTKRKDIARLLTELGWNIDMKGDDGSDVWMFDRKDPRRDN